MKKVLLIAMIIALVVGMVGCGAAPEQKPAPKPAAPAAPAAPAPAPPKGPVIGLMTGTVSQGEDEYRAAENMVKKYGSLIKHVTYPDNFSKEQETTIAQIVALGNEPTMKVIIVCQAVPGTTAAIKKVKEKRPDIKFILGVPHEDPQLINEYADIAFITDQKVRGETIVKLAHEMGAKTFLHYSFPRHLSMPLIAERLDIMKKTAKALNINLIEVTAPDPLSDAGIPGAQKFILEDVPRKIQQYGKQTAVFSTNCAMQEPLIRASLTSGCIYPEQCCPSPTHGYPGALGIKITPEIAGNIPKIVDLIKAEIAKQGGQGRFATWPVPINMVILEASVELARDVIDGKIKLTDKAAVQAKLEAAAGTKLQMRKHTEDKGNFWLVVSGSVKF